MRSSVIPLCVLADLHQGRIPADWASRELAEHKTVGDYMRRLANLQTIGAA